MLLTTDLLQTTIAVLTSGGQRLTRPVSLWGHMPFYKGSGLHGEYHEGGARYIMGNGYRLYLPVLMRFTSPDSFSPFGRGGLNAYGFCTADPVNLTDPTGHMPVKAVLEASGITPFLDEVLKVSRTTRSLDEVLQASRTIASHLDPQSILNLSAVSRAWRDAIRLERVAAITRVWEYTRYAHEYASYYVLSRLSAPNLFNRQMQRTQMQCILSEVPQLSEDAITFLRGIDTPAYSLGSPRRGMPRFDIIYNALLTGQYIELSDPVRAGYSVTPSTDVLNRVAEVRGIISKPIFWARHLPPWG